MRLARLDILLIGADIADVREGEGDDLPRVGGIGHHLLISGHGGVEAELADRLAFGAEAPAPDRPAIGENDDSRCPLRLCRSAGAGCASAIGGGSLSVLMFCGDFAKRWPLRAIGRQVNAVKAWNWPLGLVFSGETRRDAMIRDDIKAALVGAMKGGDKDSDCRRSA